ncbi:hypothetical protein [Thalassotalea sp. G2M2-11]|uniref:hypothetical protein n=1 Tax=Thalassotalea sp. G2M2-11 TaxID=2787627 RepID=UPI0019D24771|nr:hypothetical protein [Thalassotalea sp. G2M2-11]
MHNRRKIKYIDKNLQGYLMALLIGLEVIMIIAAMAYLYFSFNSIYDAQIYQIHKDVNEPFYRLFLVEMIKVVAIMSLINIAALFIAHVIWLKHINLIIKHLTDTMRNIGQLNFSFTPADNVPNHDLSIQIKQWQAHEVVRAQTIRDTVKQLPDKAEEIDQQSLTCLIDKLQQQLTFTKGH